MDYKNKLVPTIVASRTVTFNATEKQKPNKYFIAGFLLAALGVGYLYIKQRNATEH